MARGCRRPDAAQRYQRERYFSNLAYFDAFTTLETHRESFQSRLLGAHVLLLGAGGLGSSRASRTWPAWAWVG